MPQWITGRTGQNSNPRLAYCSYPLRQRQVVEYRTDCSEQQPPPGVLLLSTTTAPNAIRPVHPPSASASAPQPEQMDTLSKCLQEKPSSCSPQRRPAGFQPPSGENGYLTIARHRLDPSGLKQKGRHWSGRLRALLGPRRPPRSQE